MKPRFRRLFFVLSAGLLAALPATAQTIPVDRFEGLRFDVPIPAAVTSGQAVPLSATVLDSTWREVVISFRPLHGSAADVDVDVQYLPGRIERSHVFSPAQADTYQVVVFAGDGEQLQARGEFSPFVVTAGASPVQLPVDFFDGVRLDAPLPTQLAPGAAVGLAGRILDDRVTSARLDLSRRGDDLGTVRLPLEQGRFGLPLRLPDVPPGAVRLEWVVGLRDGTYWGRGAFDFQVAAGPVPVAAPTVLAAALLPGGRTELVVANRGDAPLHVLGARATPPFVVTDLPGPIAGGDAGGIGVRYDGTGGDEGELVFDSDDPLRPQRRIALRGVADGEPAAALTWERADAAGTLIASAPPGSRRFALALFSPRHVLDGETVYAFAGGPPPPAARAAASGSARERGEAERARRAARLAALVRQLGRPAGRAAQASYRVGDERTFRFDDFPPVAAQVIPVRVVAVSAHAVAFVHVGTGADGPDLPVDAIAAHLAGFDADYDRMVDTFGAPSDVDGDGRIAFVYTPLVDAVGLGGFEDPDSVLPPERGGNGNLTDLLFLSPTQPVSSYRSLLVHEFQHLINFHQHVLARGGRSEATWLDEGLSHVAEDLVGGFVSGGNSDNVRDFLLDPGAVGLTAQDHVNAAERGAAYLFVRSLVDRFGEAILLRLVQTGLSDRDTVEEAAGVPFRELLAGYAVRIYASGTSLAAHSRFDFAFAGLASGTTRGFPLPAVLRPDAGGGVSGRIRPRGVAFVESAADGSAGLALRLQAPADAELAAVVLPLPDDFVPRIDIPADHFGGVVFDPPLPGVIRAGQAVPVRGRLVDAGGVRLTLSYTGAAGDVVFDLFADDQGRFGRTIVFDPAAAGPFDLDVFVGRPGGVGSDFAGAFGPVRVLPGSGPVRLPVDFFDGLRLDAPLPTSLATGTAVSFAGGVLDAAITDIVVEWSGDAGQGRVDLRVRDGRFAADLPLAGSVAGAVELRVFAGDASGLPLRGRFVVRVGQEPITAVTGRDQGSLPATFALAAPYPNPFNGGTAIALGVPAAGTVEVAVYALTGQRLRTLQAGWLEAGVRRLWWDGRDDAGRPAASGVYLVRATAAQAQAARKVLLLR